MLYQYWQKEPPQGTGARVVVVVVVVVVVGVTWQKAVVKLGLPSCQSGNPVLAGQLQPLGQFPEFVSRLQKPPPPAGSGTHV
jgi:hypothetical protein